MEVWEWYRKKTIGIQWVESSDSIAANIAEGIGRYFFKEKLLFMYYSRGSLLESKTWLQKSYNRKWLEESQYNEIMEDLKSCHYLLNQYIKYLYRLNRHFYLLFLPENFKIKCRFFLFTYLNP